MPACHQSSRRSADRRPVTINFPQPLYRHIKSVADDQHNGDYTRALLNILANAGLKEAKKFLQENKTWIYSRKKL